MTAKNILWSLAALCLGSAYAMAQDIPFTSDMQKADALVRAGRYWDTNALLTAATFAPDGSVKDKMLFQYWSQFTPFVTNEVDPIVYDRAGRFGAPDPSWATRIAAAEPRDAIAEIVARAKTTRIVILNEAHYSPRDRAFAWQVARALRPLGYDVLAAEAFGNNPESPGGPTPAERLAQDRIVRRSLGMYTLDPVFANYVRGALALGYRPIGYEQTAAQQTPGGGVPEREQAQAENVMAFLRAHPTARLLIHVGHGHVLEGGAKKPEYAMMAQRLKQMSGIDPLTIDQTRLSELASNARPALQVAAPRLHGKPVVFFEGDRPMILGSAEDSVDLQIVHPPRRYVKGRPDWLANLGGRPRAIPRDLLPKRGARLIQAFAADASDDAVPLDQVLVEAGKPVPVLMVPNVPIRFVTQGNGAMVAG
ncbi:hypothetical protein [Sphingomonas sp.]|uniref:hypothetical protein n=1 Tax=Sphingomonas sp. TaxID=28214 RepID=UPI00289EC790|nr:hypothetical protein [Sphingomonas sp.]